jgi:hypothetical protein
MPQVSTVKEGGVAYLLTNFRELFQQYKTNEVDLDFFISWPYDEGGSACTGADGYSEWPWGARGFPNITHQLSVLGKQLFPNMRTVVSTWGFDRPAAVGEFAGLDQYIRSHPGAFDFTMADSNTEFPSWPIEAHHGPGDLPLLNFPEISMWGRTPWGGFGANPLPERFQQLWRPIEKLVSGGMPYSEGIFEDLNQAICFQHYWNASTTANQTVSPPALVALALAVLSARTVAAALALVGAVRGALVLKAVPAIVAHAGGVGTCVAGVHVSAARERAVLREAACGLTRMPAGDDDRAMLAARFVLEHGWVHARGQHVTALEALLFAHVAAAGGLCGRTACCRVDPSVFW